MYRQWLEGSCCRVEVLPESGRGVSYVREHILRQLAPKEGWFWIMDDDISRFVSCSREGQIRAEAPAHVLDAGRLDHIAGRHPKVGMIGLEYHQWVKRQAPTVNSYCTVCVALDLARLPSGCGYFFRSREDWDLTLQIISKGGAALRMKHIGMETDQMGKSSGGMYEWYDKKARDEVVQVVGFLWKWRRFGRAVRKVYKPPRRDGAAAGRERLDVKVQWRSLGPVTPPLASLSLPDQLEDSADLDDEKFYFEDVVDTVIAPASQPSSGEFEIDVIRAGAIVEVDMGHDCDTGEGVVRGGWWRGEVKGQTPSGRFDVSWTHLSSALPGVDWHAHGTWRVDLLSGSDDWREVTPGTGAILRIPSSISRTIPDTQQPRPAATAAKPAGKGAWMAGVATAVHEDEDVQAAVREGNGAPPTEGVLERWLGEGRAVLVEQVKAWLVPLKDAHDTAVRKGQAKLMWKNQGALADTFFALCRGFAALSDETPDWPRFVTACAKALVCAGIPLESCDAKKLWMKLCDFWNGGPRYGSSEKPLLHHIQIAAKRRNDEAEETPPPDPKLRRTLASDTATVSDSNSDSK